MGIRDSNEGSEHMGAVLAGNLDDVPIRGGVDSLEDVSACRQGLAAKARNLDGYDEGDNSLTVKPVGHCLRDHKKTKYGEAQSDS